MKFFSRFITVASFLVGLTACLNTAQSIDSNAVVPPSKSVEVEASTVDLAALLILSNKPEDIALNKKLDEIIEKGNFRNSDWGFFVVSLQDGRVLAAKNGQKPFNPASTLKLITSAAALDKLGADFRWKTSLFSLSAPQNGVIEGDLILYGHGAPDFNEEQLNELVAELKKKGIKKITGNIVGDESYFRAEGLGEGWAWGEAQWYYGAKPSALTFNENQVTVKIRAGSEIGKPLFAEVENADGILTLRNETKIAPTNEKLSDSIGLNRGLNETEIYLYGEAAPNAGSLELRVSVPFPNYFAAKMLAKKLKENGIESSGEIIFRDWKTGGKFDEKAAFEIASVESKSLAEIVRKMNKDSVNLYAELLLRTLGAKFGAEIKDETLRPRKVEHTDAFGAAVVKEWLAAKKIPTNEIAVHDGSGLSRLDFISPETLGRLLIAASQLKNAEVFRASLPIAGTDGTLRGRLNGANGKIAAKTGSIQYVSALAGYAKTKTGETLAFSIFCNGETLKTDVTGTIDELANALAN